MQRPVVGQVREASCRRMCRLLGEMATLSCRLGAGRAAVVCRPRLARPLLPRASLTAHGDRQHGVDDKPTCSKLIKGLKAVCTAVVISSAIGVLCPDAAVAAASAATGTSSNPIAGAIALSVASAHC